MKWNEVGDWIKDNAGSGAALVGSLLTGNVPGAIAAGVSLVSSATGTDDPVRALESLQNNPDSLLKLIELSFKEEDSIREHIRSMKEMELVDAQKSHEQTQKTIQSGDNAEDKFVRRTRPAQSWCSLVAAFAYVFVSGKIDVWVLSALFTLPWAYAGLRQVGKGIDSIAAAKK